MANRTILLCLLILSTSVYLSDCKWGGGRSSSRGGGSSHSSWGKGWGSSSSGSKWGGSGSSYKPSSSSSGSGSIWGSSYKPSSSWNTGSSSGGSSYKPSPSRNTGSSSGSSYPWSSSGLSGSGSKYNTGSGSGTHNYPSGTGLSGSGSGTHSYPSGTGLSGSGSGTHSYPSGTGLSGSGSRYNTGSGSGTHSYPSGTGLSGSGSRYNTGSGSGTHSYPSGTGLSGSNNNYGYNKPSNTYNTNSGYGSNSYHPGSSYSYQPGYTYHPTIYHYPQHVYVTTYRDSGSRYGDLLTGLTLYNMGRSHSHYHTDHYYYDDYYRTRYYGSGSSNRPQEQERPKDEATCTLRVIEHGKEQLLKIPCEIVSTFTEGSQKINNLSETRLNQTVCTTNITSIRHTTTVSIPSAQANVTNLALPPTIMSIANVSAINGTIQALNQNISIASGVSVPIANITSVNATTLNVTKPPDSSIASVIIKDKEVTEGNKTINVVRTVKFNETIINTTVCTTPVATDPLNVTGPPIDPSAMQCSVDIKTKDAYFRNNIDCNVLVQYSKKPLTSPQQEGRIMPSREKLKSWLEKPPWWMSIFIAT